MSVDEFRLALIVVLLFGAYTFLLRQNLRHNFSVFLLACITGFIVQLPLGRELNLYTLNVTIYIWYVSLAVTVTWGVGMTSVYAVDTWLARVRHRTPGLGTLSICGLPILVILEFIGSNVVRMKLHDFRRYSPLMPALNSMHAPPWLYAYYIAVALFFFYSLKALRIYGTDWDWASVFSRFRPNPDASDESGV
jgi:hypothetical protein